MTVSGIPSTPVRYEVDLSGVKTNQIKMNMTVKLEGNGPVDVALPYLSPGAPASDMNHPFRLTQLEVTDADGRAVPYEKLETGGWRVHREAGQAPSEGFKVSYVLRANEFDFVRDQLNEDHAYMNGAAAFMLVKGHDKDLDGVIQVKNIPDPSWEVSTTLPAVQGLEHTYYSKYFQDLADSNIEVGKFEKVKAFVNGTEITITQHGKTPFTRLKVPQATPEQNLQDFTKIYRAFLAEFGSFPLHRYLNCKPDPAGIDQTDRYTINKHYTSNDTMATGLEHYHGHELIFQKRAEYGVHKRLESNERMAENRVMAHELGHKLLAKFVQHKGIDIADFMEDTRTDGLWLTEGVTDWIGPVLERRSGLITPEQYVTRIEQNINQYYSDYQANPTNGRENSMDAQMGNGEYYNKGGLLGVMLDLEIRHRTQGAKSFTDVIRQLKAEFGGTGKYHTLGDIQRITEKVSGSSFTGFFDDYLRDRKPIDFARFLNHAGYALKAKQDAWDKDSLKLPGVSLSVQTDGFAFLEPAPCADSKTEPGAPKKTVPFPAYIPTLGVLLEPTEDGKLKLASIKKDSPAFPAGLREFQGKVIDGVSVKVGASRGDSEIQLPVNASPGKETEMLSSAMSQLIGSLEDPRVTQMIFTFKTIDPFTQEEQIRKISVEPKPATRYVIEEIPAPSREQIAVREGWLSATQ